MRYIRFVLAAPAVALIGGALGALFALDDWWDRTVVRARDERRRFRLSPWFRRR